LALTTVRRAKRAFQWKDRPPNAVAEFGADAAIAVALEGVGDGADLRDDRPVPELALGFSVEAGTRDAHQFASPPDGEAAGPLVTDVGALFREGPERTAPFKKSISSACRPTSRSSAAIRAS
jgi:hypothetical protein